MEMDFDDVFECLLTNCPMDWVLFDFSSLFAPNWEITLPSSIIHLNFMLCLPVNSDKFKGTLLQKAHRS
jgi:hypothetical protein